MYRLDKKDLNEMGKGLGRLIKNIYNYFFYWFDTRLFRT